MAPTSDGARRGGYEQQEVPPELLSLLLEMRAESAAVRAQVLSRLGRLDQRVSRMERSRANAPDLVAVRSKDASSVRGGTPARSVVAPARMVKLDDLSPDLLAIVAAALPEDDELAAALSCRKLRAAVALSRSSDGRTGGRTARFSAFPSHARLVWAVSCGLPLSVGLCTLAAGHPPGCAAVGACRWLPVG